MDLGRKVLVVDDELSLSNIIALKLKQEGFVPTVCNDGEQAVEALTREQFDAMLIDVLMPHMDGFAVLHKKAETRNAETPTFMLSAYGNQEYKDEAKRLGVKGYFVKTGTPLSEIISVLKEELSGQS